MYPRSLLALTLLAACGDDGTTPGDDHEITVEIHRNFPFVDGDTADDAVFVAVQDGDAPYAAATGTNGVYKVHVSSDRYGVAVGCFDAGNYAGIEIVQRVLSDGTTYKTVCKSTPLSGQIDVTVKNLPANNRLRLRAPLSISNASADGLVSLQAAPGSTEVFGTLTDAQRNVTKLFRLPSVQVPATGSVPVELDVAAQGGAPDFHDLTLTPANPTATVRTSVVRPYGSISLANSTALGATPRYFSLPAALQQPDDLFRITVTGETGSQSRIAKSPGALSFTLPAAFDAPNPTLAKTPFLHPTWTFTPTAAQLPIQTYILDASNVGDVNAPLLRDWFATLSSGWIAGASSVSYEFPDLSGMPGFASVALVEHERIDTGISRDEASVDGAVDGAVSSSSTVLGVVGEFCGDGIVQTGEMCDPGEAGESATCNFDCTPARCGDNIVNTTAGEECDPPGTNCSATCKAQ